MSGIQFPDVSNFQPSIDFNALRATTPFLACQVCWGTDATIVNTPGRAAAIRAARFQAVVWYVGLRSDEDVLAQVEVWQNTIGALAPNEGIAIDWESAPDLAPVRNVQSAASWLANMYKVPIGVYAGPSEHATLPTAGWRWVAAYEQPEPTDSHLAWQFTDGTYVSPGQSNPIWPGGLGKCDTSVTHSTAVQFLQAICGAAPSPPPTPPPIEEDGMRRFATSVQVKGGSGYCALPAGVAVTQLVSVEVVDLDPATTAHYTAVPSFEGLTADGRLVFGPSARGAIADGDYGLVVWATG